MCCLSPSIPERKKGFLIELLDETMMLQCTSKADMEDWVRDLNRLRGGIDLASGQNVTEGPAGQDIYEGRQDCCVSGRHMYQDLLGSCCVLLLN